MSLFGTGRREGVLAILLLLGLTFVAYLPGLILGQRRAALDPQAMAPGASRLAAPGASPSAEQFDTTAEAATNQTILLPAMISAGQVFAAGELPLWNPRARFGEPFSVSGAPLLYPPFWLLLLADGHLLLDWIMFLHAFLACMFMYRFLRILPLSRYVAFLGGGGYGIGWFLTAQMDRLPEAAAAALLPFALEMTRRLLISRRRELFASLVALAVTLMFLTGGHATALFGSLLCLALFLASLRALESSDRRRAYRAAGVTAMLTLLLSAPLWLDAIQHWGALGSDSPPARHLQLGGFVNALAPAALGDLRGHAPESLRSINPDADPVELVLYPGILVMFALLFGLFRPKRTYRGLFWVLAGGIGLLLTLDSPLVDLLSRFTGWGPALPGASLVLTHVAFIVLSSTALECFFDSPTHRTFALPVCVGLVATFTVGVVTLGFLWQDQALGILKWIGADGVATELAAGLHHMRLQLLVTAGLLTVLAGLFMAWRRLGILRFKAALAVVTFLDLLGMSLLHVPRVEGPTITDTYASHVPATEGRVMTATRTQLPPAGWLMAQGIRTVPTSGKGILRTTADYLSLVDPSGVQLRGNSRITPLFVPQLLDHPMLASASVELGVAGTSFQINGHRPLTSAPLTESGAAKLFVVQRSSSLPRARLLFQGRSVESKSEARDLLRQNPHILAETIVLQGVRPGFEPRRPGISPHLEWELDAANSVRLQAQMEQGRGYLLLADAMAPGWFATVDGVNTPLLQANLAFRAVALSEGEHTVEFVYRPWITRFGLPLLAFGLILSVTWTLLARQRMARWCSPDLATT